MPLNKLLTLSTKRSGFIVSLPLEKFETREQKKQRHLPSESKKKIKRGFLSIEGRIAWNSLSSNDLAAKNMKEFNRVSN